MSDRTKEWLVTEASESFFGKSRPLKDLMVHFSKDGAGYPLTEAPSYIALEITNGCNLQCRHCHLHYGVDSYGREQGAMEQEMVEVALKQAKKNNMTIMMNFDGEPLTHPLFFDYLKRASELDVLTYFNTNGTLLTPQKTDELLKHYKGTVSVSLDMTKELLEKNRYPAKYDVVTGHLKYLIEQNERLGKPIKINIGFSNFAQPYDIRMKAITEWLPLVDSISIGEINDDCGGITSKPLLTDIKPKKRPICNTPWQTFAVCYNGDVIPCCIYVTKANYKDVVMGNILEQSFAEIWQGEKFTQFRKAFIEKGYYDDYCKHCERWRYQFEFPEEVKDGMRITRNGLFTTVYKQDQP